MSSARNCLLSSGTKVLTLIRKFSRIFNWSANKKMLSLVATCFLRFILQEAPFNLTNILLREKCVVVLEPQVLIPAMAEELCKMYDTKP